MITTRLIYDGDIIAPTATTLRVIPVCPQMIVQVNTLSVLCRQAYLLGIILALYAPENHGKNR